MIQSTPHPDRIVGVAVDRQRDRVGADIDPCIENADLFIEETDAARPQQAALIRRKSIFIPTSQENNLKYIPVSSWRAGWREKSRSGRKRARHNSMTSYA
jgi:hypothetical protein